MAKKKISFKKLFKVKIKVNKKHLKQALWFLSVLAAGYLLFLISQHIFFRPAPQPPPVEKAVRKTAPSKPKTVSAPDTRKQPAITFVIDDIGAHNKLSGPLRKLGGKVTYAILPLLPYSRYFATLSEQTGAEVILHLPLDTTQDVIPGRGLIVSTMSESQILDMLDRDLKSVPNHKGVNNHMGSAGTTDTEMMTIILKDLKRRGLFFLDSYTTKDSVVPKVAKKVKIPFLQRGIFLDNADEKNAILAQIRELEKVAKKTGSAIAIGHYRANTLEVLAREIPRLEREGFRIISLQKMLKTRRD